MKELVFFDRDGTLSCPLPEDEAITSLLERLITQFVEVAYAYIGKPGHNMVL